MSHASAADALSPGAALALLRPLLTSHRAPVVLVVVVGLLAAAAEGIGITLLIPLLQPAAPDGAMARFPAALASLADAFPAAWRVPVLALAMLGAIVAKNALQIADLALTSSLYGTVAARLRGRIVDRLLGMGWGELDRSDSGRVLTLLGTESWRAAQGVQLLLAIVVHGCAIAVFVALLLLLSWRLTLALIGGLVVMSRLVRWMTEAAKRTGGATVDANARLGTHMWEIVAGLRTIHAVGAEAHARGRFAAASEAVRRAFFRLDVTTGAVGPTTETLQAALVLVLLVAMLRQQGSLPVLLAFALLVYRLQPQVRMLETARATLSGVLRAVDDVRAFAEQPPEGHRAVEGVPPPALGAAIRFDGVAFRYVPDGPWILQEVTCRFARGQVTAVVGASGAGKTTLLHLLCGFYEPTAGVIAIDDTPLPQVDSALWRRRIGFVGQDAFLFNATIRENIRYGCLDAGDGAVEAAAREAHAHDFIVELPAGYDTVVGERGLRLSAGQRQRIALARAFVRRPDLLVLDEATNALDAISEQLIRRSIAAVRGRCTVVVVAHRLDTIRDADHVVVLETGRVVQHGPLEALLARAGAFRELYGGRGRTGSGSAA